MSTSWSADPPDEEGLWWLYGDDEYGGMGGHYTGSIPPDLALQPVAVWRIGGGHLQGVARGRFINLTPFDAVNRQPGYLGVWQKIKLPELPDAALLTSIGLSPPTETPE